MTREEYQLTNAKLVKHLGARIKTRHVITLIAALANHYRLLMRFGVVLRESTHYSSIGIINSFPIPFCVKVRNVWPKSFDGDGNIGYNATRKIPCYGFKAQMLVSVAWVVLNYEITPTPVSDVTATPERLAHCSGPVVLTDVDHVGQPLQRVIAKNAIQFWTCHRSKMKDS
ncbi:hypothetical protein GA516_02125 [Lactobacillus pentosus]|jgi:hypothetical protein|uniref:transposase n=1 Tax=Lactiplantibacillus pentosus TaxID=1589 RepID=UPI00128C2D79|nr:transposase [Lactiplantibacillus pentosus]MCH4130609.1 hypothetical protein [Lactiplantibacillus sp.]BBM20124.1 transposase [Lactiplantibacillus plantarum]MCT3286574.1 hypothetical protein [Lactiplantibacillus pentosus]MCT3291701.1 hypothetical protein [Lactiplantibacillus pentosus]MPQ18155.1 hypothetical protein [Lactiplantibacillus pentosus]